MSYRVCRAMKSAGITDAESQQGIDFCVNKCPYDEGCTLKSITSPVDIKASILKLQKQDLSVEQVADKLGINITTVYKYIR